MFKFCFVGRKRWLTNSFYSLSVSKVVCKAELLKPVNKLDRRIGGLDKISIKPTI